MPEVRFYMKNHLYERALQRCGGSHIEAQKHIKHLVEMWFGQKKPAES